MIESDDRPETRVLPPVIPGVGVLMGYVLQRLFPWRFLPPEAGSWIGWGTFAFAAALALAAAWRMIRAKTHVHAHKSTTRIVTDGVFAFTRNPIYLGMVIAVVGVAGIVNSLWVLLTAAPVAYALQKLAMEPEERYLEAKFGQEYLDYKARVRRWL